MSNVKREGVMMAGGLKLATYRVMDEEGEWGGLQFHMTYDNTVMALMGESSAELFVNYFGPQVNPELFEGRSEALKLARGYSRTDGAHHKAWILDQMVRALTGKNYELFVRGVKKGEDGPDTYDWDEGIAP